MHMHAHGGCVKWLLSCAALAPALHILTSSFLARLAHDKGLVIGVVVGGLLSCAACAWRGALLWRQGRAW
jgi:hypothetical protein